MNGNVGETTSGALSRILRAWGLYGLIFIVISALLINGEAISVQPARLMAYAILLIGFMQWYDIKVEDFYKEFGAKKRLWGSSFDSARIPEHSFIRGFVYYITFFAFTWVALVVLYLAGLFPGGNIYVQSVIPELVVQMLVVSVVETLVFQVMLFIILKRELVDQANISLRWAFVPILIASSLIFGFFHWWAFQGDLLFIFIATVSGGAFFVIAWFSSPISAMSCHASYNLFVIGITSGGVFGLNTPTLMMMASPVIILIMVVVSTYLVKRFIKSKYSVSLRSSIIKRCKYESKKDASSS